jgi:glycosyltransferase involved in cell wall biosynthesis
MMNEPLVSVIIPVYNSECYLSEAIESVLSQTYRSLELIVVDDGSTDRTRDIALSFPELIYIYQANSGTSAARNRGIHVAKGDYIAFLDADDLWLPDKITLQIAAFIFDPKLDIVTGLVEQFIIPELDPTIRNNIRLSADPLPGYIPSAMLVEHNFFERFDLFDDDLMYTEFIDWFIRVKEMNFNIKVLPDVIARRRIHGNNVSIRYKHEKNKSIVHILKASLDRKRTENYDEKETQ